MKLEQMDSVLPIVLITLGLLAGILVCIEVGFRLGRSARLREPERSDAAFGVASGALLGLLGLILAFSFGSAQSRLERRQQLVVQEANAIGTAYLRLDLLRAEDQPALRKIFRQYIDSRLQLLESRPGELPPLIQRVLDLQTQMWTTAVAACEARQEPPVKGLVLAPMNDLIDLTTTLSIARKTHLPPVALLLLILLALLSGVAVGQGTSATPKRSLMIWLIYAMSISATVYVILDLEMPRLGLIQMDVADEALRQVRDGMK